MSYALAIDVGTTNTAAAVRRPGGPPVAVRLGPDALHMPSAVYAEDDRLVAGPASIARSIARPDRFERNPKRRVGEGTVYLGGREWRDRDLLAAVLRVVLEKTVAVSDGQHPARLVLTHPDAWGTPYRNVLSEAGTSLGCGEPTLMSEPIAAAVAQATLADTAKRVAGRGRRLAVFDFGGGTLDVAVLVGRDDTDRPYEVEASAGEQRLGGADFDKAIFHWILSELEAGGAGHVAKRFLGPNGARNRRRIWDDIRRAKHDLATEPVGRIGVQAGDYDRVHDLGLSEFTGLIGGYIDRAVELTAKVLDSAGGDVSRLWLTGGSSWVIPVARAVGRECAARGIDIGRFGDDKIVVPVGALHALDAVDTRTVKEDPVSKWPARCQRCGAVRRPPGRYCAMCGLDKQQSDVPQVRRLLFCPACGTRLRAEISYCTRCGTQLASMR